MFKEPAAVVVGQVYVVSRKGEVERLPFAFGIDGEVASVDGYQGFLSEEVAGLIEYRLYCEESAAVDVPITVLSTHFFFTLARPLL